MNDLKLPKRLASYVNTSIREEVAIIIMNRPDKLNGWTKEMMQAFSLALANANQLEQVKAIILTGTGKYYSAGVNLSGTIQIMHPKALRANILKHNQDLFETFLKCEKPLLIAINGHALGASVTSATLANAIIAAESASFSTPFAALGITPEGCSSVHFERLMGKESAARMLGNEGWRPNAKEAKEVGLIQAVVPDDELEEAAFKMAREWIDKGEPRRYPGGSELAELLEVNAQESEDLADAFLSAPFMKQQGKFLWSKKKRVPALTLFSLWATRPLWSRLL